MIHNYLYTAILLNTSKAGNTAKSVKSAKASEDFAGLTIEHDDIIVDDISVSEVVAINERILAVTYHVRIDSDLDAGQLTDELQDTTSFDGPEDDDYMFINFSAINLTAIAK